MLFLVNAGGRMARRRRKHRKHHRTGRVRAAHHRRSGRRKRRMPAALRAYWAAKRGGGATVARKRRRYHRGHRGHRGHRRRGYRINPSVRGMGRGFVGALTKGATCGAFVTLGEALSVALPGFVKLPTAGFLGLGVRALVGTAVGVFGKGMLGAENAAYVVAGAWGGIYRTLARQFNVPLLAPALSGYPGPIALRGYAADAVAKNMIAPVPAGTRDGGSRAYETSGMLF